MQRTQSKLRDRKKWGKFCTTRCLPAVPRLVNINELRTAQRFLLRSRSPPPQPTHLFCYSASNSHLFILFVQLIDLRREMQWMCLCCRAPLACFYYFLLVRVDDLVAFSVFHFIGFGNLVGIV